MFDENDRRRRHNTRVETTTLATATNNDVFPTDNRIRYFVPIYIIRSVRIFVIPEHIYVYIGKLFPDTVSIRA